MTFEVASITEVLIFITLSTCLHHLTNTFILENELECFQYGNIYELVIDWNLLIGSSFAISSGIIPYS